MVKTVVLVSGGGTNLQAIIDADRRGEIKNCALTAVISSNPSAYALERAKNSGIPAYIINTADHSDRTDYANALFNKLQDLQTELIVCAGFLRIIDPLIIQAYKDRIINIHPALIPAFSGSGYYGLRVHEAALSHGVKITGATVHFVTEVTDDGPIILQKAVPVLESDTAESLQRRVMEEAEWEILPKAISLFCEGRLKIDGRKVRVME